MPPWSFLLPPRHRLTFQGKRHPDLSVQLELYPMPPRLSSATLTVHRDPLPGRFAHGSCTKGKEKKLKSPHGAEVPWSKWVKWGSWLIRCSVSQFSDPRIGSKGDLGGCRVRARNLPTWKSSLTLTKAILVEYSRRELDLTHRQLSGRKHTEMTEVVTGWLETLPYLSSSLLAWASSNVVNICWLHKNKEERQTIYDKTEKKLSGIFQIKSAPPRPIYF